MWSAARKPSTAQGRAVQGAAAVVAAAADDQLQAVLSVAPSVSLCVVFAHVRVCVCGNVS